MLILLLLYWDKKRLQKGCLHGKSEQEKIDFFVSLEKFAKSDPIFFNEQCNDLLLHELEEFHNWIKKEAETKRALLSLVNATKTLLNEEREIHP